MCPFVLLCLCGKTYIMNKSLLILLTFFYTALHAQDVNNLVQKVKAKLDRVNDYEATGRMKTNVVFLKVPIASVKIYFKKPNKLRIKNEKGISFIPKGAVTINMNNILADNSFTAIDGGIIKVDNTNLRIIKLLPQDDNSDVVLSTLYIDETNLVIRKAKTTTKENGTYELDMSYGKYSDYGLPDKVIFTFNTKDYKVPKGVTFDFDDSESQKKAAENMKNRKGRVEIDYKEYTINKGLSDEVFK